VIALLSTSYRMVSDNLPSKFSPYIWMKFLGIICVGFDITGQLLNIIFAFIKVQRKKKWKYSGTMYQLFIDFNTAYDIFRRQTLYDILIEFGVLMKLVRLIKMCLNEVYSSSN
jgi:hypothetical protein